MPIRPGPFSVLEIAQALARLPGRLEVDQDEASRILDDILARYERGDFAEDEIMVHVTPQQLQPLKTVLENAQRQGEPGPSLGEIRVCAFLSYAAAKRYVEECGLGGAPRFLAERFQASPNSGAFHSTPPKMRGRPGPKPLLREGIVRKMLDDLSSGHRTLEQLRADKLSALTAQYGGSSNTAKIARTQAVEQFAEIQKSNSETNSEKL